MSDDHSLSSNNVMMDHEHFSYPEAIKYLANNGTVLNNMFCTNSICVPSRASILTGQYSHQNGVYTLGDHLSPDSLNVAKASKQWLQNSSNWKMAFKKRTLRV